MKFLAALVIAIGIVVAAFHYSKPLPDTDFDEAFLPKASSVQYMALGHNSAVAGLFWISGLTDLGNSYYTGKEYAYLSHVADISTTLDSLFYTPYYFVGLLTPSDTRDTTDYHVMRKALRLYPDDWRMALSFALRLSNGAFPDKKAAADVMRPFLTSPDSTIPPHIRVLHRIFELDTMQTEIALETALNDVLQPNFKKFRTSFYGKIYRLLGYKNLITDAEHDPIYLSIRQTIDDLVAEKISFQQAYFFLLQNKKVDEPKSEEVSTDSTAAVLDSASSAVDSADSSSTSIAP